LNIAIISDWLTTYAGAERCIESFNKLYKADNYSLVEFLSNEDKQTILNNNPIKTTFIQNLPFSKKLFRNYLPLFPYAIENINVTKYDVILSSSHAVAKNVLTHSNQIHICYCHTPIRYGWDMYFDYIGELKGIKKIFFMYVMHKIRMWDYASSNRVDYFIANSKFIQKRIKKIYNKNSTVIYPPIDTDKFEFCDKKEEYYITMSRLVPYKRVDLIIKAFNKNKKNLIVIGDGDEFEKLKSIAHSNIQMLGFVEDKKAIEFIQKAKGFVFAALEDFGITPLEAQACGTPVIALNKGGTAESVIDGITGIHFENQTIESINDAINKFENTNFDYYKIRKHSLQFDRKVFEKKIYNYIKEVYERGI